ncbi:hypothetical protein TWF730_001580 [Orbilia blumenaviensis]|uniref:Uncharacterized protein n=1 Tax=Orbilia blumenaviensis TaxID=1796055 RepID=A0AAV9UK79_9PEZI
MLLNPNNDDLIMTSLLIPFEIAYRRCRRRFPKANTLSGISDSRCFEKSGVWFMSKHFCPGMSRRFDIHWNYFGPVIMESGSDMTGLWQDLSGQFSLSLIFWINLPKGIKIIG